MRSACARAITQHQGYRKMIGAPPPVALGEVCGKFVARDEDWGGVATVGTVLRSALGTKFTSGSGGYGSHSKSKTGFFN